MSSRCPYGGRERHRGRPALPSLKPWRCPFSVRGRCRRLVRRERSSGRQLCRKATATAIACGYCRTGKRSDRPSRSTNPSSTFSSSSVSNSSRGDQRRFLARAARRRRLRTRPCSRQRWSCFRRLIKALALRRDAALAFMPLLASESETSHAGRLTYLSSVLHFLESSCEQIRSWPRAKGLRHGTQSALSAGVIPVAAG